MKLIHFMPVLCLLSTVTPSTSSPATDAHLVAQTIKAHIASTLDPECNRLQKALKASVKQRIHDAKQEMRDTQKKIQEECNEEKKRVYDVFSEFKKEQTTEQENSLAILTALIKEKQEQETLNALIGSAYKYIQILTTYSNALGEESTGAMLRTEKKWFENIEKTTNQAGISLEKPLEKEKIAAPKTKKKKTLVLAQ